MHDAIRQRELEAGVPRRVVRALAAYGGANDDVLWAALFVLAVLVRDGSSVLGSAAGAVARAGGLEVRCGGGWGEGGRSRRPFMQRWGLRVPLLATGAAAQLGGVPGSAEASPRRAGWIAAARVQP